MKLLITSDIHNNKKNLEKVLNQEKNIDYHLDAGDSELDKKTLKKYNITTVRGNMDFDYNLKLIKTLNINGYKILLVHGHTLGVKNGFDNLKNTAKHLNVDICIFGHTHVPHMKYEDGILYLNPGSLSYDETYIIFENNKARFLKI